MERKIEKSRVAELPEVDPGRARSVQIRDKVNDNEQVGDHESKADQRNQVGTIYINCKTRWLVSVQ